MGSCFQAGSVWKYKQKPHNNIYNYVTPGILYFKNNMSVLSRLVQRDSEFIQNELLILSEHNIKTNIVNTENGKSYYVSVDINTVRLTKTVLSQLHRMFDTMKETIHYIDMGTGVFHNILMVTVWTLLINNKFKDYNLGEALVVVPSVLRNTVTEKIVAKTVSFITENTNISTTVPRFVFLSDLQNLQVDIASIKQFQFVHTGVCTRSYYNTNPQGLCQDSFGGFVISDYSVDIRHYTQLTNQESSNLLDCQKIRDILQIVPDDIVPTTEIPCPSHTYTKTTESPRQCHACADNHYSTNDECLQCDITTRQETCLEYNTSMYTSMCSFSSNSECVLCPASFGCPLYTRMDTSVVCGNGVLDIFTEETCDSAKHAECCTDECTLLPEWELDRNQCV